MMLHSDDIDDLKAKRICFECVGEAYLSGEIEQNGKPGQCSYCGKISTTYAIEELAEIVEAAFRDHFYRTPDQPSPLQQSLQSDRESDYMWEREGAPVVDAIECAAEVSTEVATDIQMVLDDEHADFESAKVGEETEFSSDSYYEQRRASDWAWQQEWQTFEESLKTEARFFSRIAASHLASVFGGIDKLRTVDGRPLVLDVGPKRTLENLYRARVFQSEDRLKEALCRPDILLASPPANLASAGRMNARGISVFYGATERHVALAEVRPPVGSKVVIAEFGIMRPIRLLDLTALEDVQDSGSIFDPSLKGRLERVAFLQTLGQRMTKPVMPDDEAFDYLATQAIADFLATENEPLLDGIIFPSAQVKNGKNVVLFHKAARAEVADYPDGTSIEARTGYLTEDGWEVDYTVYEGMPPPTQKAEHDLPHFLLQDVPVHYLNNDFRENTLRIVPSSVEVHEVAWVEYHSTDHQVYRHRFEQEDSAF